LSNYFASATSARCANGTAVVADRVEDSLQRYLDDHAIDQTWETRERLIVGITAPPRTPIYCAGPRASRRTPGELFACTL